MKKILFLLLFLLNSWSVCFATDWTSDSDCEGAWLMEIDEDPLTDSSGNNRTLNLEGGAEPTFATATPPPGGFSEGYYDWDGNNDLGIISDNSAFSVVTTNELSIVTWANPDTLAADDYLITKGNEPGGQWEWAIKESDSNGNLTMYVWSLGGSNELGETSTGGEFSSDNWHHIAMTVDHTAHVLTGYVDGVQALIDTTSGSQTLADGSSAIAVGRRNGKGNFDGFMDELSIFSREFTSTEVNEIMDYGLDGSGAAAEGNIFMGMNF